MNTNKILASVASFIVSDNGSINWEGTLGRIRSQLEAEISANAERDVQIEAALDSLYDMLPPGAPLPTPTVVQTVAAALAGGNLAEQVRLAAEVDDYLKRSTRFVSKRGRSGGLFRIG
jgi:hypothetical protein